MNILDTHAHIYATNTALYPPSSDFDPLDPPEGTGTLQHLMRETNQHGVDGVVVVHTSSMYGADNRFLVDSADGNESGRRACVRWTRCILRVRRF